MAFAGPPIPDLVWDDFRRGTSLGSDLTRLVGGGLFTIGGIKRQQEREAAERADRLSRERRLDTQFDRQLSQSDEHFQTTRADRFTEKANEDAQDQVTQDTDGTWRPVAAPVRSSVPQVRAAGQQMSAQDDEAGYERYKRSKGLVCEAGST